jgi:hypothetical protein
MPVNSYQSDIEGQFNSDWSVVFTTDLKESNNGKPTEFKTPTRKETIPIPLGATVIAHCSIKMPGGKIKLDKFEILNNDTGLEDSFSDKLTSSIVLYNAVDHLWSKGRLIPELDAYIEQSLKHLPKNDNKISTKGNIAKAVLFTTYLYAVNNIPRGFQQDYLEKKLGMNDKYVTQVINRYSVTFDQVKQANKTKELFSGTEEFAVENKSVYFVRHTDKKLRGGYMPNWLKLELEQFLNAEFNKIIGYKYELPAEYTGATD